MLTRKVIRPLTDWKEKENRHVLLLRGARQVGKTYSVREFSKSFASNIEINFLEKPELKAFFKGETLSPESIVPKLEAYFGVKLISGKSLLFLDEIQECKEALGTLRFFHEKMPELHVIAAGSLLEFALKELPSFGVGRITSLFMHPLSFAEFVDAWGEYTIIEYIKEQIAKAPLKPVDLPFHSRLMELYRTYMIIGGLPKVVSTYLKNRDLNEAVRMLDSLLLDYEDDFAKYGTKIEPSKMRHVFNASAKQSGKKFVYTQVAHGQSTSGIAQALQSLMNAGIVHKIECTFGNGIPLGAEIVEKKFKVIPFDAGIYNRLLGLPVTELLLQNIQNVIHSGASAEVFCGTELIKSQDPFVRPRLFYWARDTAGSQAEVDYIVQKGSTIIPIEVKAGTRGQMQSLYTFMTDKKCSLGYRVCAENFSEYQAPGELGKSGGKVRVVPMYWSGEIG